MNFDFTEEQKLFAEAVHKFAQAHLAKDALKRAHEPRFPFDVAKLMSRRGSWASPSRRRTAASAAR